MNNKRRRKLTPLYIWHRYTGLLAALFVIFISLSGIALNHTDDLALKNQYLSSNFLLERYKVQPPHYNQTIQSRATRYHSSRRLIIHQQQSTHCYRGPFNRCGET